MHTHSIVRPDGTRSTYHCHLHTAHAIGSIGKPHKTKLARSEKRVFPSFFNGWHSTADYVKLYFAMNSARSTYRIKSACVHAYDDATDHAALYLPLNTATAQWCNDEVEIEEVAA